MKDNKTKTSKTSNKKISIAGTLKVLAIAAIVTTLTYFLAFALIVAKPVNDVKNEYKKQTELLQEIANRTEKPLVLKTNEELQSLTDDEAFALLAELGTNDQFIQQFEGSASKFVDTLLVEYSSDIKVEQVTGLAEYLRAYCGTSDLNVINMTGAVQDYMCNIAAVVFFEKATPAINDFYNSVYSYYNESTEHPEVTSPLQLNDLVSQMIVDAELKTELLGSCTAVNRIIQAEYYKIKTDYISKFGDSEVINGIFFDTTAQSIEDLVDLRMIACEDFSVTGSYIPMNLSDEDAALIEQSRADARQALIDCNIRFNMTADGDNVKGLEKLFQTFAMANVDAVYDEIADYNIMELSSHLHSPLKFTEEHTAKYTRDYVFWNLMLSVLSFENATTIGTPTANMNYKTGTLDYGFITGDNPILESELDSLLWATAEQTVLSYVYDDCNLTFDSEGNVVAEDTNDELVAAYRNWFEAWNLWGSQFTQ